MSGNHVTPASQVSVPDATGCIDTHCHLEMLDDAEVALAAARAAGVAAVIAIGIDLESSRRAVSYAESHDDVFATVGMHPHDSRKLDEGLLTKMEKLASSERVRAIGECGLDYYRDRAPRDVQQRALIMQFGLARQLDLPIVVHVRDAEEDAMTLLREFAAGLTVILHCFSLTADIAECNERGYYASFAGNLTYKSAGDLRAAAALVREDRLLIETDAPFLTPMPYRGKDNRPAWIGYTAAILAECRGWDIPRVTAVTAVNARRAFGLVEPG